MAHHHRGADKIRSQYTWPCNHPEWSQSFWSAGGGSSGYFGGLWGLCGLFNNQGTRIVG